MQCSKGLSQALQKSIVSLVKDILKKDLHVGIRTRSHPMSQIFSCTLHLFLLHPRIDRLDEAMRLTDLRERGSHHQFLSRQNTILSRPVKNSPFSGKSLARISLQLANRRFVQLEVDSEIIWLLTLKKFPIPCSHTSLPIDGAARNCLPFYLQGYARSCNLSCLDPFIFLPPMPEERRKIIWSEL